MIDPMPKRTTPRQTLVYLLRKYTAEERTRVRESVLLRDAVTGHLREVDVVLETVVEGEPITICFEITERKRRADRPWAEQMIKKHERLPTNRLVLVSWSNFTPKAKAAADAEGGWVVAVTPRHIEQHGIPLCETMAVKAIAYGWPVRVDFRATRAGLTTVLHDVPLNTPVVNDAGETTCRCAELTLHLLQHPDIRSQVTALVDHHGTEIDGAAYAVKRFDLSSSGWYLRIDSRQPLLLEEALVCGLVRMAECEVEFWLTAMGDRRFFEGRGEFLDREAIWLAVPGDGGEPVPVAFRAT